MRTPVIPLQDRPWLTRADAAALARVSLRTIAGACLAGDLPEYRGAGDRVGRIKRTDLDRWREGTGPVNCGYRAD